MSIVPLSHIRNTNTVSDVVSPSPKGGGDSPPLNPTLICYVACLHSKYFGVAVCVVGDRRVSSGSLGIPERISASGSHTHTSASVTNRGIVCYHGRPALSSVWPAMRDRVVKPGNPEQETRRSSAGSRRRLIPVRHYTGKNTEKFGFAFFFRGGGCFFASARARKLFVLCHNIPCFLVLCSHCCINLVWKMLIGCCFVWIPSDCWRLVRFAVVYNRTCVIMFLLFFLRLHGTHFLK